MPPTSVIPVSIVICTYNRAEYLIRCIESLKKLNYPDYEIIVVNGPSTDATERLLHQYPDVSVVRQESLNGLSFARNLGIRAAKGHIIAFIDDDAVADDQWLGSLVTAYTDDTVGGAGGPVFDITGNWYQFKNGYISKEGIPSFINEHDPGYNDPKGNYLNYIMGTNASFRKEILVKVGLFDENYRYYLDETDVCVKTILAGYKIRHINTAVVFHEMAEGHNRRSQYDINYTEILKNHIYFILKNFRGEIKTYTIRPLIAVWHWIKIGFSHYSGGNVTFYHFLEILISIMNGAARGYWLGLTSQTPKDAGSL